MVVKTFLFSFFFSFFFFSGRRSGPWLPGVAKQGNLAMFNFSFPVVLLCTFARYPGPAKVESQALRTARLRYHNPLQNVAYV